MKKIFKYQTWHLLLVIIFLGFAQLFVASTPELMSKELWSISSKSWFWIAVATPIVHQIYVWLVWRLELYKNIFSSLYGLEKAFKAYKIGFSILFVSRLIFIIILSYSDMHSLEISSYVVYTIVAIITLPVIYLFYSVKKYFTIDRAFGIDHFDKSYNVAFEKKGIFRFTNNGMYIYGLMILYIPGLLLFSKAALVVALFNHIYIWVHYYTTELPDIKEIYGKTPIKK
ncbi:methyltransferase [Sulfurimonas sp. CS5]|uniref:DUF1295 domain-containing protein n=1 Tax=uncultured microorganism TaxID=358574 RepID=L8B1K7_9ZZZZ|nr:conserved hypothetical protein [uncultured microorganism]